MRDTAATAGLGRLEAPVWIAVLLAAVLLPAALPGYGGGWNSLPTSRLRVDPVRLRGAVGAPVEWSLPLSGGCSGPYVMTVLRGALPPGVTLDQESHAFRGTPIQAGEFGFQLQVDDTGCAPFETCSIWLTWHVDPAPTAK